MVGETVVAGKLPIRIERFGRPEIKNHILSMKEFDQVNRDLEIRDLYNLEDAFHMSKDYRGAYRARLNANLAAIDRLDGKTDWPLGPDGAHPLTELLLDDYLVVDVSKPYAEDSYFEIERAAMQGRPHETCGGRSLNDERDGHPLHAARQRRQRTAHQRRRGPGDGAGVRRLPLPGAAQSRAADRPASRALALRSSRSRPRRRKEGDHDRETDRHPGGRRHSGPVAASPPHPLRRRRDSRAHRRPARRPEAAAPPHSIRPLRFRPTGPGPEGLGRRGAQLPGPQGAGRARRHPRQLPAGVSAGHGRAGGRAGRHRRERARELGATARGP